MAQMSWNEWLDTRHGNRPAVAAKPVDDAARQLLVEQLAAGQPVPAVAALLQQRGYAHDQVQRELEQVADNPYFTLAHRLAYRQLKRDWVLDNARRLENLLPVGIEERQTPSRQVFLRDFYAVGQPVVIKGAIDHWPALGKWTPEWLAQHHGDTVVEIQGNRERNPRYEMQAEQHVLQMKLREFIARVQQGPSNDLYMTARNSGNNSRVLARLWDDVPGIAEYLTPGPGQGFFWFGPAGTITPLHHDLTNNFMAQVYGRKRVLLVSAASAPLVYNDLHCFSAVDAEAPDWNRHPAFRQARVQEVVLCPGDLLFLPVGCWHHVRGLDVSITMSFTNFVFDNDFSAHYRSYGALAT